jgi:hypothetical protein
MEESGLAVGGVDLVFDLRISNCELACITDRDSERFSVGVYNILISCHDFLILQVYADLKKWDVHKRATATLGSSQNLPSSKYLAWFAIRASLFVYVQSVHVESYLMEMKKNSPACAEY